MRQERYWHLSLRCSPGTSAPRLYHRRRGAAAHRRGWRWLPGLALVIAAGCSSSREPTAATTGQRIRNEVDGLGYGGLSYGGQVPGDTVIDVLDMAVAERERTVREAYASCAGTQPSRAELDAWIDSGLDGGALSGAICGSAPEVPVDPAVIVNAFTACLGRPATGDELSNWLSSGLSGEATYAGICNSEDALRGIIAGSYLRDLGRQATEQEVNGWVDTGGSRLEIVRSIRAVPGAGGQGGGGATLPDQIRDAYTACLGRAASQPEVDGWVATGRTAAEARAGICGSEEARRHGIAKAYQDCLGRAARPDEINAWYAAPGTIGQLRDAICASRESRLHAIRLAYQHCLHRTPAQVEIDAWDVTGLSVAEMRWGICTSVESRQHGIQVVSHLQPTPPFWHYDYFVNNCHTAANKGVLDSPLNTGIISCRRETGVGTNAQGIGGHTFNYVRNANGTTSYYNWGRPPCTCDGPPPADFAAPGCHRRCVEPMCGDQFLATETRPLPVGQLVEIPGPSFCATRRLRTGENCEACCDARGNAWADLPDPHGINAQGRASFVQQCKQLCTSTR